MLSQAIPPSLASPTESPSPLEFATLDPYEEPLDTGAEPPLSGETSDQGNEEWNQQWTTNRFRVAPNTRGRSSNLTESELAALRYEELMARTGNVRWQDRGPANVGSSEDAAHWRGQPWREGENGGTQRCSQEIHSHTRITFTLRSSYLL